MKSLGAVKHFLLAFLVALVGYVIFYQGIELRRIRKGPWQVAFTTTTSGAPCIIVAQPSLAISNVQVTFVDAALPPSNTSSAVFFNQARPVPYNLPFGKCVFMDTTFLPGTVTMQLFGHEIELLPRVLIIDHQEHPWLPDSVFNLHDLPVHAGGASNSPAVSQ